MRHQEYAQFIVHEGRFFGYGLLDSLNTVLSINCKKLLTSVKLKHSD